MILTNRNSLFDEMFRDTFSPKAQQRPEVQIMKTDVYENEAGYMLEMELPGYSKEDINADLEDGHLIITASREEAEPENDPRGNCIRRERYTGGCQRSFYVGEDIKKDEIRAAFRDGILRLVVPKKNPQEIAESSRITIE